MAEDRCAAPIRIEVAYADAQAQILIEIEVPDGTNVKRAIALSGILARVPAQFELDRVGICGRLGSLDERLRDGDRVELYRPLQCDPKTARRRRAAQP